MLQYRFDILMVVMTCTIMEAKCFEVCGDNHLCIIRFYERQYFKGSYWTLDSTGEWKNSRPTSRIKYPYRNFHVKSIRSFCSLSCSWKICPAQRRRKYSRLSRKKKCRIVNGNESLETLRLWGSANSLILGSVRRIKSVKPRNNTGNEISTTASEKTTNIVSSTKRSIESTRNLNTSTKELMTTSENSTKSSGNLFLEIYNPGI